MITFFVRPFLGLLYEKVRVAVDKCFTAAATPRLKPTSFWTHAVVLLIAWVPYLVVFAPGSPVGLDFSWQISQFFGYADWDRVPNVGVTTVSQAE